MFYGKYRHKERLFGQVMDLDTVYIFYDTESTGTDPSSDDIISFGASYTRLERDENNSYYFKKYDDFHTYIWTNRTIPEAAIRVHHITKDRLRNMYYDIPEEMNPPPPEQAPEFEVCMSMIEEWVHKWNSKSTAKYLRVIWCAHNGKSFDDPIMFCNAIRHNVNIERFYQNTRTFGFLDSLPLFKNRILKNAPTEHLPRKSDTKKVSFKLGDCYKSWCGGDDLDGAHDALVDTLALIDCCNSVIIRPHLLPNIIMPFVITTDKALQKVRSKVGRSYQDRENTVKRRKLVSDSKSATSDDSGKASNATRDETNYCSVPVFEDVHCNEDNSDGLVICLSCVTMVEQKNHDNCVGLTYPISNPM